MKKKIVELKGKVATLLFATVLLAMILENKYFIFTNIVLKMRVTVHKIGELRAPRVCSQVEKICNNDFIILGGYNKGLGKTGLNAQKSAEIYTLDSKNTTYMLQSNFNNSAGNKMVHFGKKCKIANMQTIKGDKDGNYGIELYSNNAQPPNLLKGKPAPRKPSSVTQLEYYPPNVLIVGGGINYVTNEPITEIEFFDISNNNSLLGRIDTGIYNSGIHRNYAFGGTDKKSKQAARSILELDISNFKAKKIGKLLEPQARPIVLEARGHKKNQGSDSLQTEYISVDFKNKKHPIQIIDGETFLVRYAEAPRVLKQYKLTDAIALTSDILLFYTNDVDTMVAILEYGYGEIKPIGKFKAACFRPTYSYVYKYQDITKNKISLLSFGGLDTNDAKTGQSFSCGDKIQDSAKVCNCVNLIEIRR